MIDDEELAPAEEGQDDDARAEADDDAGGADEARQAIEAQAREQGWRPVEEWRGDKSRWMDAEKFIERTKPAKIRESVDELARENRELKRERAAERAEFEARAARLEKVTQIALKRQREQTLANVKAAKRQAVDVGDIDAYDQLEAHEGKVVAEFATEDKDLAPVQPAQRQQPNAPDPTIHGWVSANAAVRYNDAKWTAAQAFFTESEQLNPEASVEDHLAHVETRINEVWPGTVLKPIRPNGKANGNGHAEQPRQRGPQLEGGTRMAARGGVRQKGFADIPAEERRIYKDYIKEGLFKDEADAAKAHWS